MSLQASGYYGNLYVSTLVCMFLGCLLAEEIGVPFGRVEWRVKALRFAEADSLYKGAPRNFGQLPCVGGRQAGPLAGGCMVQGFVEFEVLSFEHHVDDG